MTPFCTCLVFMVIAIDDVHADFSDITAFRQVEDYKQHTDRGLTNCGSSLGCIIESVTDNVLKSFTSLPITTIEAVYNTYLGQKNARPTSYLDAILLHQLKIKYGSDIDALNTVLGAFFNTNVTHYLGEFAKVDQSFEEAAGAILGRLRQDAGVNDTQAEGFWGSINILRSYHSNNIKDALADFTNKTIWSFTSSTDRKEYCEGLLETLQPLGGTIGFKDLKSMIESACLRIILPQNSTSRALGGVTLGTRARTVYSGYTTATSKCGSIRNVRVASRLRTTLNSLRVVGGQMTGKGEYKFLATLLYRGSVICTASIIDATHVMTAAHCTVGSKAVDLSVGVGEWDTATKDGETIIKVKRIRNHHGYNDNKVINDISILKLSRSISVNRNAEPICLPRSLHCTRMNKRKCFVAGWGAKKIVGNSLIFPRVSRDGTVYAYHGTLCPHQPRPSHAQTQLCATGPSDTCNGDSGGPLFCQWGKKWTQCGITSYGPAQCNAKNTNGIYTHVTKYRAWIKSILS